MKNYLKALTGVAVLTAVAIVVPVAQAAPLLSRVNQAMRDAGIVVTGVSQLGWGEGVVTGHYKNYQQLVDAMKWHKQLGRTIPDSSKFTAAVTKTGSASSSSLSTGIKTVNNAEVVSISPTRLTVKYGKTTKNIKITKKQYDALIGRSVMVGSSVKVALAGNTLKGNVINNAPAGQEQTYGNVNGGGGGGSDSGGGGT